MKPLAIQCVSKANLADQKDAGEGYPLILMSKCEFMLYKTKINGFTKDSYA